MYPEKRSFEGGGDEALDSFLTPRQIKVLQMRLAGLSQQEVADCLGTTRSNISILEKRAHQNIARARRTLEQWMMPPPSRAPSASSTSSVSAGAERVCTTMGLPRTRASPMSRANAVR